MIDIDKCRNALSTLLTRDYTLHVPPQEDDPDVILSAALCELDRFQKEREFWKIEGEC